MPADGMADPTAEFDGISLPEYAVSGLLECGLVDRVALVNETTTVSLPRCSDDAGLFVRPQREHLQQLRQQADLVLVHDPARALAPVWLIRSVVETVLSGAATAVVPAAPVTDTIKIIESGDELCGTWQRDRLREVQSPLGCRTELLSPDTLRVPTLSDLPAERVRLIPGDPLGMRVDTPVGRLVAAELSTATREAPRTEHSRGGSDADRPGC